MNEEIKQAVENSITNILAEEGFLREPKPNKENIVLKVKIDRVVVHVNSSRRVIKKRPS